MELLMVLISFREWLHSYDDKFYQIRAMAENGSHLFQRVASFLQLMDKQQVISLIHGVLISFREWLHSYSFHQNL